MPRVKTTGIALEMVQFLKPGRLSQWVEPLSEAAQMLESYGWKQSAKKTTFYEVEDEA